MSMIEFNTSNTTKKAVRASPLVGICGKTITKYEIQKTKFIKRKEIFLLNLIDYSSFVNRFNLNNITAAKNAK